MEPATMRVVAQADFHAQVNRAVQTVMLEARPEQRARLLQVRFVIQPGPSKDQLQGLQPGSLLAGQYDGDQQPPTITLFRSAIEQLQVPVEEVVRHEVAHALGYSGLDDTRYACGVAQGPAGAKERSPRSKDCPICILDESLAYAAYLMRRLAEETALQGRVPVGLGGTIPLAAEALRRGCQQLPKVAKMLPERGGELRSLSSCLARAAAGMTGWLDGSGIKASADQLQVCSKAAYQLAWAWFARGKSPLA